jgi:hypothetical protein
MVEALFFYGEGTLMTTSLKSSLIILSVFTAVALVSVSARADQLQPAADNSAQSGSSTVLKGSADSSNTRGNSSSGSYEHAAGTQVKTNTGSAVATGAPSAESAVRLQTRATIAPVFLSNPVLRRRYEHAAASFDAFCSDWERLLHDREVNNLEHLNWHQQGGYETATYTGYGKIEGCECKASKEGLPIGKIRYEEISYYLIGKTIEDAKHAVPKMTGKIETLEIFSWEKNKWFY